MTYKGITNSKTIEQIKQIQNELIKQNNIISLAVMAALEIQNKQR